MVDPMMVFLCYVLSIIAIILIIYHVIEHYLIRRWAEQLEASSASGNLANLVDLR